MLDPSVLAAARDDAALVQIRTRFSDRAYSCFPIEVGRDLGLFLVLDEGFHLDGLRVLRPQDLIECTYPHPYTQFVEEVLAERGEDEIELPALSMESMVTLLETAVLHVPLLGLYSDELEAGMAKMGRLLEVDEERLTLLEVDQNARWAEEPIELSLSELTRVDLGGSRLEAYYLVAGEPE